MDQRGLINDPGSVPPLIKCFVNMDLGPYSWTINMMPHVYYTCIYVAHVCSWETTDIPVFLTFYGDFYCILIDLICF